VAPVTIAASQQQEPDSSVLVSSLASAEETLNRYRESSAAAVDQMQQFQLQMEAERRRLLQYETRRNKTIEALDLVHSVNVRQIQLLIEGLQDVRVREQARREREDANKQHRVDDSYASQREVQQKLQPARILASSEKDLEAWIAGFVEEQVAAVSEELFQNEGHVNAQCVPLGQAVAQVQTALSRFSQDGIGLFDHASEENGATIVHQFTSSTYRPAVAKLPLGTSPWRNRFLPEDWEGWLPDGWERWEVPAQLSRLIPDYLYHSAGGRLKAAASTAPPETVLHPNTLPGACWPMDSAAGNVTVRLPYPVHVRAITIDHASKSLLVDADEQLKGAPRHCKLYGYAPCESPSCQGLGFDPDGRVLLTEALYDIDRQSPTQTFHIETEDHDDDGSCSAAAAGSCGGGGPLSSNDAVSAVQWEVVDNWGNGDYTCLYRLRVHGDPEV
jgi:SUN domain-containing protein 1/2